MFKIKDAKVFGYKLSQVQKFLVALAAAFGVAVAALSDGVVTAEEGMAVASALVGALLVFRVPNKK